MPTEIQESRAMAELTSDDDDQEEVSTQVYVDNSGEVHHGPAPETPPTSPAPLRLRRQHGALLQFVGITMLPSTQDHLTFDAMLRNAEQLSAEMHAARMRRRRYPSIPKNAARAVKTERVQRVLDPATDVAADDACIVCQDKRGRKRSPAWRSPCCGVYFCDGCARNLIRFPFRGVCEACTRCARSRGGAHCIPLGGPPGPEVCTCKVLCPQKCSGDGMRSFQVEMEAQAALEAEARSRDQAKMHRRPRMKRSSGSGVRKRRRVETL